MNIREITSKVELKEFKDETFSKSGKPDFTPEQPEIKVFGPRGPQSRPRTKASQNNSYT